MNRKSSPLLLLAMLSLVPGVRAAGVPDGDIADLTLEQLNDIVVTSVSRQEEKLGNAAASLYVISATDIRRSGARSLPEALRLAPNLEVARVDARNYAISARGFNNPFANKLLVLIDGRSVYSPFFSAVFWDAQSVVMEDIERIEVISGPGSTIWGVNAVNGVINVITRHAKDSQGTLLSVAASGGEGDASLRFGGRLPENGYFRAYAQYMAAQDSDTESGVNTYTGMQRRQAGFRADWELEHASLSLSGDAYQGNLGQLGTRDIQLAGANLVARYLRRLGRGDGLRLQLVLDHVERNQPGAFVDRLDSAEVEGQHDVRLGIHKLSWGGGYRHSRDDNTPGPGFGFWPYQRNMHWGNLFAQDEITLARGLHATGGVKVEHNTYTGAEWLPTLRLAWSPDTTQTVWSALSRTVRSPARVDRDFVAPPKPFVAGGMPRFVIATSPDFESEVAKVLELGYRAQPAQRWSYSVTAWYADYDRLRTTEPNSTPGPYRGSIEFRNLAEGRTRGIEFWARWQPLQRWRLNAGLVVQDVDTGLKPGSKDATAAGLVINDPSSYWQLRSSHELGEHLQLDWTLRYNGSMPKPYVPSYHELDANLVWQVRPEIEVALAGQNLLHTRHAEWGAYPGRSVFERRAVLKLTMRY
ncbi:TonB-dependent receptor plug domain-containing protein [Pseudoduganella violaceinigra]|uniref:TonB-dependent receptor plug domain-containing protein n=1 Tax=Pseudoduganella violaceinigra TaxID=246602 RepID=UPI000A025E5D|nr:TonB-dependent receptor [Pseudoduganella violaceinigra]